MDSKRTPKLNIPMCAALVLLFLTLISIHLTSGLFARYTAESTAFDAARVAKFDVQCQLTQDTSNGKEGAFILNVTNNSEVAVKYKIVFTSDDSLDAKIADAAEETSVGNTITFTNEAWTLAPNEGVGTHKLQLAVTNWSDITADATGPSATGTMSFKVDVVAEQID